VVLFGFVQRVFRWVCGLVLLVGRLRGRVSRVVLRDGSQS